VFILIKKLFFSFLLIFVLAGCSTETSDGPLGTIDNNSNGVQSIENASANRIIGCWKWESDDADLENLFWEFCDDRRILSYMEEYEDHYDYGLFLYNYDDTNRTLNIYSTSTDSVVNPSWVNDNYFELVFFEDSVMTCKGIKENDIPQNYKTLINLSNTNDKLFSDPIVGIWEWTDESDQVYAYAVFNTDYSMDIICLDETESLNSQYMYFYDRNTNNLLFLTLEETTEIIWKSDDEFYISDYNSSIIAHRYMNDISELSRVDAWEVILLNKNLQNLDKISANSEDEMLPTDAIVYNYSGSNDNIKDVYINKEMDKVYVHLETQGWADMIELLVAINDSQSIEVITILNQSETPGLGSRVLNDEYLSQFIGVKGQGGISDIDAISGATQTYDGVMEGILSALEVAKEVYSELR